MIKIVMIFTLFMFLTGAYADIRKCTGADGKITFSDGLCPSTSTHTIVRERDNTIDTSGLRQAAQAQTNARNAMGETGPDSQACTDARTAYANAVQTKIDVRSEKLNVQVLCGNGSGASKAEQTQNRSASQQCADARQNYANAVNTKLDVRAEKSDVNILCGIESPPKTTLRCRDIGSGISHCR
jgi:hypothetical protein